MSTPAPAQQPDLELQLGVPLLESRERDTCWRIWRHLPRRDTAIHVRSLAAFLVKSAEGLGAGILTLNVFNATHFLSAVPKQEKEQRLDLCFSASANQIWKVFVLATPFILYPITLWISGMARMAERDQRGLSVVSFAVIMEFILFFLASSLLTHCITEASPYVVSFVMVIAIVLLLIVWTITFNRPKCFRMFFFGFCRCGLAPDTAAAEANDQSIAAAELARQVAIAQGAFAVQVRLQAEAFAATKRALDAADANKVADEEADKASLAVAVADNAMRAAESAMNIKNEEKSEAYAVMKEQEAPVARDPITEGAAQQSITEVGQNTSTPVDQVANPASDNYCRVAKEAARAAKDYKDACVDFEKSEKAHHDANQNVVRAAADALAKKEEATEAMKKVLEATAVAEEAFKNATAARSVTLL